MIGVVWLPMPLELPVAGDLDCCPLLVDRRLVSRLVVRGFHRSRSIVEAPLAVEEERRIWNVIGPRGKSVAAKDGFVAIVWCSRGLRRGELGG